MYELTVMNLN